jgi:CubicO group peptidase (beta-lactamase class C family)
MAQGIAVGVAEGYRHLYDDRPPHASHPLVPAAWIEMNAGDCCIASTAEDLARFARMLLNRGQGPVGPLLSSAGYELLLHGPMATEYGFAYGYGIKVRQTNFRVVLRKGALWLVWPAGNAEPLAPVGEGLFRVSDESSPERLRFSQVVDGQALCANLSGSDYYRFFTP